MCVVAGGAIRGELRGVKGEGVWRGCHGRGEWWASVYLRGISWSEGEGEECCGGGRGW